MPLRINYSSYWWQGTSSRRSSMLSVHRRPQRYHPAFHVRWLSPRTLGWLVRSKRGPPCLMTERKEDPCQLAQVGSYNNIYQYKTLGKARKEFTYILLLHVHYNIWRYHFIFLYIYIYIYNWKKYWPSLDHSCRNRHLNLPSSPAEVCTVAMLGLISTDITPASCGCAKRVPPNATIPENDTALTIKGFLLQIRKQPLPTQTFVQL